MNKRSVIISIVFCSSLFVASLSPFSSNNTATATATSHPDEFKCSLNHIFKPNLYKKETSTANKNTNTLYYYKTTHEGEFPNKVYGLSLCVFGISLRSCRNCLRDAIVIIKQQCHGAEEAILWYDQCLVRYSYRPFFSTLETVPNRCTAASNADLYVANFTDILYQTFLEMIQMATFDAFNKHAIKATNISGSNIVLALHTFAQCIPNLSTEDCLVCLNIAVSIIPSCDFQGKKYGSILIPSCFMSYELYQFYRIIRVRAPPTPTSLSAHDYDQDRRLIPGGAPPSTPISPSAHDDDEVRRLIQVRATPTPTSPAIHEENHQIFRAGDGVPNLSTRDKDIGASTTSHKSKRRSNALIIFLAIGIFILLLLLPITYLYCRRRREKAFQDAGNNPGSLDDLRDQLNNCQEFSLASVREATQNFNIENKLGQGGYGPVYKGTLESGKEIAVKRLESTPRLFITQCHSQGSADQLQIFSTDFIDGDFVDACAGATHARIEGKA
ncbi:hypothetical protein LWI29_020182 [Acer saccharum]|uniref:Gnk2-homologous domain-containing protein n=1 Tax=Acer saccharum TaxID=4024 RepID=A0AA39RXI2_ACESA|nr:hypothetical protein LWI29_020182 [Acer saccharum]